MLQAPVEITNKASDDFGGYPGKGASSVSSPVAAQKCPSPEKGVSEKKDTRSMSALLRRHCGLNIPRSSVSIKTSSRGLQSPKWFDSVGVTEEEGLVDKKNEKWVEEQEVVFWGVLDLADCGRCLLIGGKIGVSVNFMCT